MNYNYNIWLNINEGTVPKMMRLSAQTSTVAFIWEFMRQWYWNWWPWDAQFCATDSQFIFLAASFQDTSSIGQLGTCFTVRIDFWHPVNAETYVKIGRARNVKIFRILILSRINKNFCFRVLGTWYCVWLIILYFINVLNIHALSIVLPKSSNLQLQQLK